MRFFAFLLLFFLPLFCKKDVKQIYHKTVGQIEAYKEKYTLNLRPGCVSRLTKNLLTPIHKRKHAFHYKTEEHLITKNADGPLTIKFLLPLSLKKDILTLLSKNKLILSIPFNDTEALETDQLEIDRHANPPAGLFAMKSRIETDLLSPSEVVFIHLLKDET